MAQTGACWNRNYASVEMWGTVGHYVQLKKRKMLLPPMPSQRPKSPRRCLVAGNTQRHYLHSYLEVRISIRHIRGSEARRGGGTGRRRPRTHRALEYEGPGLRVPETKQKSPRDFAKTGLISAERSPFFQRERMANAPWLRGLNLCVLSPVKALCPVGPRPHGRTRKGAPTRLRHQPARRGVR